jgi:hypothetical protein
MTGEHVRDPLSRQLRIAVAVVSENANATGVRGEQPSKPALSPVNIRLGTPAEVLNSSSLPPVAAAIKLAPPRIVAEALLAEGDPRIPSRAFPGAAPGEGDADDASSSDDEYATAAAMRRRQAAMLAAAQRAEDSSEEETAD